MSAVPLLKQLFLPDTKEMPSRRYDLDWLRVAVFGLLIFYHVGMMYVANWGYHIKSQYLSAELENLMLLVNPWRMPVLWLISGIAIRFVLGKVAFSTFLMRRSVRLLLPLLFGVLVVVPPQLYYEMTFNGDLSVSYWEFYRAFFDLNHPMFKAYQPGIWPHIDVNHLWYLRELWCFTLYLIPLLPLLNSKPVNQLVDWIVKQNGILAVFIAVVPILLVSVLMKDTREPLGFMFMIYGYLIAWKTELWERLRANCKMLMVSAAICYVVLAVFYNLVWIKTGENTEPWLLLSGQFVHSLDRLIWVLALLGLAYRFLNRNSARLSYFNEAVYPYYILHQTIIIVVGFELSQFKLGPIIESGLLLIVTFAGCALSFELIRRIEVLRPLFGLKLKRNYQRNWQLAGSFAMLLCLVPFGLEILF
ncbi:acyltransferase family protein [Aliikangiella coralliicola]|uniref:Acyltransferase family protein n=1 Tax=Aliikangiella coralliicola TaxID=2592383 RepID=A0A545UFE8_9GAMM|nr:acyltransferase family protein [Aliikangiella coralliicola]TQV88206.1 acyltransferase family protein [Aliikangiella coralliicola]